MESLPHGQKARVLLYLVRFGSITQLEALQEFGVMRLASVIFRLRKQHLIETVSIENTNRFGEPVKHAKYIYHGKKVNT